MNRYDLFYSLVDLVKGGRFYSARDSMLPACVVGLSNGIAESLFVCTDEDTYREYSSYKESVLYATRIAQREKMNMHTLFTCSSMKMMESVGLACFINAMLTSGNKRPLIKISKSFEFAYSHRLQTSLLSEEGNHIVFGKCNNLNGHGHNAILEVTVKGYADPVTGMLINFTDLGRIVKQKVVEVFDHMNLNVDLCSKYNQNTTTCENTLPLIWKLLEEEIPILDSLRLSETSSSWAELHREDL